MTEAERERKKKKKKKEIERKREIRSKIDALVNDLTSDKAILSSCENNEAQTKYQLIEPFLKFLF